MKDSTFLGRILSGISNFKKKRNILEISWLTWVSVHPSCLGICMQSEKKENLPFYRVSRPLSYTSVMV